ncbi:MAG: hypothetical protein GY938_05110 [Ketobacter sp.]|nr:hypothetical protein [Ketobacter sp.]
MPPLIPLDEVVARDKYHINITKHHGHVVIQLDRPAQDIPLTVQEAAELAKALAEVTRDLAKDQGLLKGLIL